jgi:hypothetical protein
MSFFLMQCGYRCKHILQSSSGRFWLFRRAVSSRSFAPPRAVQGDRDHDHGVDQAGQDLAHHDDLRPPGGGIDIPLADRRHGDNAEDPSQGVAHGLV